MIKTSALLGASGLIYRGKCTLRGVMFVGDTATEPTLTLANSLTDATLPKAFCMVSDETHTFFAWFGEGIHCSIGIYATLSAATGDYIVYYEER